MVLGNRSTAAVGLTGQELKKPPVFAEMRRQIISYLLRGLCFCGGVFARTAKAAVDSISAMWHAPAPHVPAQLSAAGQRPRKMRCNAATQCEKLITTWTAKLGNRPAKPLFKSRPRAARHASAPSRSGPRAVRLPNPAHGPDRPPEVISGASLTVHDSVNRVVRHRF